SSLRPSDPPARWRGRPRGARRVSKSEAHVTGSGKIWGVKLLAVAAVAVAAVGAGCATRSRAKVQPEGRLSCAGPHPVADSANGRMRGRVIDADDGAPLAGVEVSVATGGEHQAATTDDDGAWEIAGLTEGRYNVVFHRGDRVLYSTPVNLCPEDVTTLRTPLRGAK